MKKWIFAILIIIAILSAVAFSVLQNHSVISPLAKLTEKPKPLFVYTFENLKKTKFNNEKITLGHLIDNNNPDIISQTFYFPFFTTPGKAETKKVSGVINLPKTPGAYPVIVMFRGFIPKESYTEGAGTQPSASVFAKNGFITIAPDFLGYGESDKASDNGFEDRFQTYTTALTLLSSLDNLNSALSASYSGTIKADLSKIGIWGHSNGGNIALSALAISDVSYPAVLWAPVSKSFPYSILYYTDESEDQGKALRKALADFEELYNTDLFSPPNYYKWIKAPIEIHQGTADHEVPIWWSDKLVDTLKKNKNDVTYFTYPGADHNLLPDAWSQSVFRSIDFYNAQFSKK